MAHQTIIPHLAVRGGAEAIEFYKKAFGFEEVTRMQGPGGMLMHGELRLDGQMLFLADEFPGMGAGHAQSPAQLNGSTVTIHLNVPNADAAFAKAVAAGAKATMPVQDMFWGERYGMMADPFGHFWSVSHRTEDLSVEEMKKRGEAMFAKMGNCDK